MTILLSNTLEGGTNGIAVSAANSGGVSGNAFNTVGAGCTYSSVKAAHGGMSAFSSAKFSYLRWNWTASAHLYFRVYLNYPVAAPGATSREFQILDNASATVAGFNLAADGRPGVVVGLGTAVYGATPIVAGAWFRLEMHFDPVAGSIEMRHYADPDSVTPTQTVTATGVAAADVESVYGPRASGVTTFDVYSDDWAVSTDGWVGPAVAPFVADPTETFTSAMNRLAGTVGLDAQGAAQVWASEPGAPLLACLNKKAGTVGVGFLEVLNDLAGTTGLGAQAAASQISS